MWLFAGITSISFKYSNCLTTKVIVKKLKQRSQSARNFAYFSDESTSETLRDNYEISSLSIHVPTHLKPINNNEFGHYLAGLIEGDGSFYIPDNIRNNKGKLNQASIEIVFTKYDLSLANEIKHQIGGGYLI